MLRTIILGLALGLGVASAARSDGLVYRLPADGTWERFSMKSVLTAAAGGEVQKVTVEGTLTVSSVGRTQENGEACRWLEIIMQSTWPPDPRTTRIILKVLIPEKYLKKGENPQDHWIRGWVKVNDDAPQARTKEELAGPTSKLYLIVSGPLQKPQKLGEKVLETGLGKLTCPGISGVLVLKGALPPMEGGQPVARDLQVNVQSYFNDKAPFGVVWSRLQVDYDPGNPQPTQGETVLSLIATGAGAKSELPDSQ